MKMITEKHETELEVCLSGELNAQTTPELSEILNKELSGVKTLTLDFSECDFVSSAGLRLLLLTFKQMKAANGDMKLKNVGENFMDVLENTGLGNVFGML